jgi:beta-galactosidase
MDFVMGQFRWGSFDYLGETNNWPSRMANFGTIDICGFPKDHFYLYQSMWTDKSMVHILPNWTHPGKEGVKIPVVAYTNCDEVELFLNGKSLGNQKYEDEQLVWMVPYESGTIKAVAKKDGKIVADDSQTTAGKAAKLILTPDKTKLSADRSDVVHVTVDIADEQGVFCPYAENVVHIDVSGPAKIIGIDNGDPIDLSDYKTNVRRAFRGKVMVLIQTTDTEGKILITARSGGLMHSEIVIHSDSKKL